MKQFLEFSEEVRQALQDKKPVLALESTLITHGLPYPQNIEIALEVERIAREYGVVPATIAIMGGKIRIGLNAEQLAELVADRTVIKAGRRDIPYLLSRGLNAGTTVGATMHCAHAAGINVFATGGIGGVHRGDELDISADLTELARTPVAVICAGAKAILDLARTLEFLETYNVPVIGYRTSFFPAFYSATSPYKLHQKADDVESLWNVLRMHWVLDMTSGILVVNPIPKADEIPAEEIEPYIHQALNLARQKNITGKAITPFLLTELTRSTSGKSMSANLQLIRNNVRLGSELAVAACDLNPIL